MARLIVGHVTDTSAQLWVRGDSRYPYAHLTVRHIGHEQQETLSLEARHGFTGYQEFKGLAASMEYQCEVEFSSARNAGPEQRVDFGHCRGRFHTAPALGSNAPFSFLLGSCNLHSLGIVASPDRAYEELLSRAIEAQARFMIHCGDQIYYDIPHPAKAPDIDEYREKYLDAWGDSRPTRKFLTQMPQYMIMDDHEITNDFANDRLPPYANGTAQMYKQISMKAYREYVHIRQPNSYGRQALYYSFSYGNAEFFVMDCRTERYADGRRMISDRQLAVFKDWLNRHADALKFVVTSVPFVGEVRDDQDKWSSDPFRGQKEEIIDHVVTKKIGKIVFLTGDMHNSYHGVLKINPNTADEVVLHELMSSPINQLEKSDHHRYESPKDRSTAQRQNKYRSLIPRGDFYGEHSNAMLVEVEGDEVVWTIFRTKKRKKEKQRSFQA